MAFTDCHAEIVSRRCLVEFLYRQLEQMEGHIRREGWPNPEVTSDGDPAATDNFSIFIPRLSGRGYKLKVSLLGERNLNTFTRSIFAYPAKLKFMSRTVSVSTCT